MKTKLVLFILLVLSIGLSAQKIYTNNSLGQASHSPLHGINMGTNGSTGFPTNTWYGLNVCGMNYVAGSVMTETRSIASGFNTNGTGFPATINISGLPTSCSVILQAYLYYDASYTEVAAPTTTATLTNPAAAVATYSSTISGTGPEKCWGETGTATYRADVTAAISGNGNYTINLNGFANAASEVDGCTLFIIYQAGPTTGTTGTLFLFDGSFVENTYSLSVAIDDSVFGLTVCNNSNIAQSFFIIADATDDPASYTTNVETANKTTLTFPNNQWNFNIIPTTVTAGQTANTFYPYRNDDPTQAPPPPTFDCYNWVMLGMYYQNTGCVNCIPIITNPTVGSGTLTNVSCFAGTDGSAIANVTGGTPPYTYTWAPSGQTGATATGLSAGTYTVTVEDVICNTTSIIVTITQPALLTVNTTMTTAATCGSSNGVATATANGGTSPYTYAWTPAGGTNAVATGLSAGTYHVTVTDINHCNSNSTLVITNTGGATVTISAITNVLCNGGNNGSATATLTGGTAPYTYAWTPIGGTNATASGLTAGTFTITVQDAGGCSGATTVAITQPPLLTATIGNPTNSLCNGGTGSATATATGGTAPYTYLWNPTAQATANATGLTAGPYTVTVTDANGCTSTAVTTITQPALLTVTIGTTNNVSCNGGNNGSATTTVTGGTIPYTYAWAPSGGNKATGTGLTAGTFTVTATDKNGCTATTTATITQPTALGATTSFTPASCNLNNGSATATVTGGTNPYTYVWSPSAQTTVTATGIGVGTYTVNVTDNNGCHTTATVTITQPSAVTATITASTAVSCNGGIDGSATATATGGNAPYTYLWEPGGNNNATANGLDAHTYTVIVTDASGCQSSATINITQPALLSATMGTPTNPLCNGGKGSATVTATGGTIPYTYSWAPQGGNNATGTGLDAGAYTVTVSDKNTCTASATVLITQPNLLSATMGAPTNPLCNGATGNATVTATGGTTPYIYSWAPKGGNNANGTGLSAGTFTVTVADKNGCSATATVTITQPPLLTAIISGTTGASCNAGTNGTATATETGGTGPYTYLWEPGGNSNATATGLSAHTYTVVITDANGCMSSAATTVTQPTALTVIINGPTTLCSGGTGTLTATVGGGTAPYTYAWSPGITSTTSTATITPIVATTYIVIITDANGCQTTGAFNVGVGSPLSVSISGQTSLCVSESDNLCATASGGTGGNTYVWQPGNLSNRCVTVTPALTTTYTLSVTDNCGISASSSITVNVNQAPKVYFYANPAQGCVPLCIQFYNTTTLQGGTIAAYEWDFGNGDTSYHKTPSYCYPASGQYTVTLTAISDSGCSSTLHIPNMISAFAPPKAAFTISPQPASIIAPTVQFTDQSTDLYGITYWTWTYGDRLDSVGTTQNTTHTYQDTGTYCATLAVMDPNGCTDTVTNCLIIDPVFTFYIPSAFTPNGDGRNETFAPKGIYIKDFEMYIFDRWGEQLFYSNDINKGWNGKVKNGSAIAQEDVYAYKIIVTDWQKHQHTYIGSVTLLK